MLHFLNERQAVKRLPSHKWKRKAVFKNQVGHESRYFDCLLKTDRADRRTLAVRDSVAGWKQPKLKTLSDTESKSIRSQNKVSDNLTV